MSDRLVTVASFQDPMAATLAKNYLDSEGIPSILMDETTIATDWLLSSAIGGVKLQVAPIHVERAEMLLDHVQEEAESEEPVEPNAIASKEIAEDLQSEQEDKQPINQLVDRLFRVAVLGMIFWPLEVYALWLLFQFLGATGQVSANRRWKLWACGLLSPMIVLMLFLALTCALPGVFTMP